MSSERNLGARLGAPLRRIRPDFDMDVWRAKRALAVAKERRALSSLASNLQTLDDDVHLVVAPHFGPDAPTWYVAGQNHFFEVYQSAQEILGPGRVTLFGVERDEPTQRWHRRLLETMHDTKATHLIAQIENDPNQAHMWTWDVVGSVLAKRWSGALIGVMYDSAFPWLRMKAQHLGRIMPNLLVAELCEPMTGEIRPDRIEVGPMTMPLSRATVDAVDTHVAHAEKIHQLTFIGALYDYRVELIDQLRSAGVDVAVNPHRPDVTRDFDESRRNQPRYLDYLMGLAQSEMTLNFSLASGGPVEQYKIRVQEASLVGCLCLTDDRDRTRHFFAANEYAYFSSLDAIPEVVSARLSDIPQLRADQQAARVRAHELARTDFWGRIEDGLGARGLPGLTGIRPPREPIAPMIPT